MKTTTKEKTAPTFDVDAIEFAVVSSIQKNTLPKIRDSWKSWLDSYNPAELDTDQDFMDAAKFVADCKQTEEKFEDLEDKAIKGDVSKVITEIRSMKEATRSKRLEFSRALDQRKDKLKRDAVAAALRQLTEKLAGFEHRRQPRNGTEEPEYMLQAAIKGKSSITMMQRALEGESDRILAEAKAYSDTFTLLLVKVYGLYEAAGETATDSELDLLVSKYYTDAPERANLILQQKKVAREQAALDEQKEEAAAKPEPAQEQPAQPQPAAPAAVQAPEIPLGTLKIMRVGATFTVANEATTRSRIESIGGRDVKFVPMPS